MKIRTKLLLVAILPFVFFMGGGFFAAYTNHLIDKENEKTHIADDMRGSLDDLTVLTHEYFFNPVERALVQWQKRHDSLEGLLLRASERFEDAEDKSSVKQMTGSREALSGLFSQLVTTAEKSGEAASELKTRLFNRILQELSLMGAESRRLHEKCHEKTLSITKNQNSVMLFFFAALFAFIFIIVRLLEKGIIKPIEALQRGTEIVGSGDLNYKVGTGARDEIGHLSRAFDNMTENLTKVMASRDELNREMEERRQLAEALQGSERKYRNLVENALVGVYKSDLKGDIHYANDALYRMLEFGSPDELISAGVIARYKNPRDREALIEGLKKTGRVEDFEAELITRTGKTINILLSAVLENDILSGMIMDITARKRNEEQLLKTHRELSALYGISSAVSRTLDMDMLLNNILNTLTGLAILDVERKAGIFIVEGEKMDLVAHLGHTELFLNAHKDMKLGDCLCGIAARTGEIIISYDSEKDDRHTFRFPDMTPHGHIILPLKAKEQVVGVLYLYLPVDVKLDDDKLQMLIAAGDQIGMAIDHARLYEETKALSLHDSLTGLSNRHFFNKIIEREMATVKRNDETVSFIMIDLDHFKEINDTLGHLTGDRILVETANLIRNTVRKADLVFRFGGDEFLVLLTNTDCNKTNYMVTRLMDAVGKWNKDNAEAFGCRLSFSLGCAICEKECDVHTAIKKADERMYQNKREKKQERIQKERQS